MLSFFSNPAIFKIRLNKYFRLLHLLNIPEIVDYTQKVDYIKKQSQLMGIPTFTIPMITKILPQAIVKQSELIVCNS